MNDRIKVWVVSYGENRKNYVLQWIDQTTGKRKSQSAGTANRRDAERAAIRKEDQLNSLRPNADGRTEWDYFRYCFENEHCSSLKESSGKKLLVVLNSFTRLMQPQNLRVITTPLLSQYAAKLRHQKRKPTESTIAGYLGHMRVALRWAHDQGMISEVPKLPRVTRSTTGRAMKGRPLTRVEFAKMLRATSAIVGKDLSRSWMRYLHGLWLSGLRLDESLHLTWDNPAELMVDFTGDFPVMQIPIERDKGHRQRVCPMTPDFVKWLKRVPKEKRVGYVFCPMGDRGNRVYGRHNVGRMISEIGKKAGIIVDPRKEKFASAHDIRRSFGTRWAAMPKITPQILKDMMRHESIETTMTYYIGLNAQTTAATLWESAKASTQHPTQQ